MSLPRVVSREEWLVARKEFLAIVGQVPPGP
jgi:hypothetical protein